MSKKNAIFGIRAVIEAVNSGKSIDKVLVKQGLTGDLYKELTTLLKMHNITIQKVPVEKIDRLTKISHQGVAAFVSPIDFVNYEKLTKELLEKGKTPFYLVLDGITDIRNFGGIARTAECAGVDAIIIPEKGSAAVNADAIKTSAGALFRIPVCRVPKMWYVMKFLKSNDFSIVGAFEKSETDYRKPNYANKPVALVLGSEDKGISSQVAKMVDNMVSIPVKSDIGSLNVSVAAGLLIYEIANQRE
ncbi:23S rRNA (guanosine(2251)-2'-O)-methyltransferase RlmB [Marinilabiliaceae bacterium ANBcel2]|nr:23S rRNA (guanosine(2251)-2'-O)-methyltransferase RlmB [Marinilabiliaceae bacterium ANBcel2]